MSAAAYPAVTNARATGDYFHGTGDGGRGQWALGGTSLFYWAIGILPFKDGYYSSTNKQVGGQTVGPEKNPVRVQFLVGRLWVTFWAHVSVESGSSCCRTARH